MKTSLIAVGFLILYLGLFVGHGLITLHNPPTIGALVKITPQTFNLKSRGRWITAHVQLPESYKATDINVSTVLLDRVIPAEWAEVEEDKLMVKFDADLVRDYIWSRIHHMGPPHPIDRNVELKVDGKLFDDTPFEGSDTIRVINRGGAA